MMERRESHLTHRQPSNKASLAWLLVCTVGAALLAVMIATQGALAHANHDPQSGWFQKCALTKTGQFDPIVYPNTPPPVGTQKLFFGATNISPDSSKDTLLAGGTTCRFKNGTELGLSLLTRPAAIGAPTGHSTCCCATARGPAANS